MIQVSVQQTKQKEFAKAVNALKKYIYTDVPLKSDKKLSELLETVLNRMFYEDRLSVKKHYYREWYAFVAWLLLEVNIPPRLLLDYLKLIQNIIRNKYSRYSVNINYYFDPEVFKKSFTHKKLFQKRLKHIFLIQLVQSLNKNAKRAIQVEQILDKPSPQQKAKPVVVAQQVVVPSAPPKQQQQQQVGVVGQSKKVVSQQQKPVIVSVKASSSSSQQKPLVKPKGLLGDIRKGLVLKNISQQAKPVVQDQSQKVVSVAQQQNKQKTAVKSNAPFLGDILKGRQLKKNTSAHLKRKPINKKPSLLDAIKQGPMLKKVADAKPPTIQQQQKNKKKTFQQQHQEKLKKVRQSVFGNNNTDDDDDKEWWD